MIELFIALPTAVKVVIGFMAVVSLFALVTMDR